jgi:cbb3-type cytochrome oxidase subunit 1
MSESTQQIKKSLERNTAVYVLYSAPGMLALCMTMIGLIKIYAGLQQSESLADNFLAIDCVLFLVSFVFSYLALRTLAATRRVRFEKVADIFFLAALVVLSMVAVFVTLTLKG